MSPDAAIERAVSWAVRALAEGETRTFVASVMRVIVEDAT